MSLNSYYPPLDPSLLEMSRHLELLWQQKYPSMPTPPDCMLLQYQEELMRPSRNKNDDGSLEGFGGKMPEIGCAVMRNKSSTDAKLRRPASVQMGGNVGFTKPSIGEAKFRNSPTTAPYTSYSNFNTNYPFSIPGLPYFATFPFQQGLPPFTEEAYKDFSPKCLSSYSPSLPGFYADGEKRIPEQKINGYDGDRCVENVKKNQQRERYTPSSKIRKECEDARDAVDQHFQESLQRMRRPEVGSIEIAQPSFTFSTTSQNVDRVHIKKQKNLNLNKPTPATAQKHPEVGGLIGWSGHPHPNSNGNQQLLYYEENRKKGERGTGSITLGTPINPVHSHRSQNRQSNTLTPDMSRKYPINGYYNAMVEHISTKNFNSPRSLELRDTKMDFRDECIEDNHTELLRSDYRTDYRDKLDYGDCGKDVRQDYLKRDIIQDHRVNYQSISKGEYAREIREGNFKSLNGDDAKKICRKPDQMNGHLTISHSSSNFNIDRLIGKSTPHHTVSSPHPCMTPPNASRIQKRHYVNSRSPFMQEDNDKSLEDTKRVKEENKFVSETSSNASIMGSFKYYVEQVVQNAFLNDQDNDVDLRVEKNKLVNSSVDQLDQSSPKRDPIMDRFLSECDDAVMSNSAPTEGSSPGLDQSTTSHHKFKKAWLERYSGEDQNVEGADNGNTNTMANEDNCTVNSGNKFVRVEMPEIIEQKVEEPFSQSEPLKITESNIADSPESKFNHRRGKGPSLDSPIMPKLVQEGSTENTEQLISPCITKESVYDFSPSNHAGSCDILDRLSQKQRVKRNLSSILQSKPLNVVPAAKRKKSQQPFLQDSACSEITGKIPKCRECRSACSGRAKKSVNKDTSGIFCRFYAFRKLQYNNKGLLTVNGFSQPTDAEPDDVELWMPLKPLQYRHGNAVNKFTHDHALYILDQLASCFNHLIAIEARTREDFSTGGKYSWKRSIQGVREMCDACNITLFDSHFVCPRCGFAVCYDCYLSRAAEESLDGDSPAEDSNSSKKASDWSKSKIYCAKRTTRKADWLTCTANRQEHDVDSLLLTQIIPSDVLTVVTKIYDKFISGQQNSKISNGFKNELQSITRTLNGYNGINTRFNNKNEGINDSKQLNDINECNANNSIDKGALIDSEVNVTSTSNSCFKSTEIEKCLDLPDTSIKLPLMEDLIVKHWRQHQQLTKDKFKTAWANSQPMVFPNCHESVYEGGSSLDDDLWNPESLSLEYGHLKLDVFDCFTGCTSKQFSMEKFWNCFSAPATTTPSKLNPNQSGNHKGRPATTAPIALRLRDWILADCSERSRTNIHRLPLPEYLSPEGSMNLVSHVPEFFARPDLVTSVNAVCMSRPSKNKTKKKKVPTATLR